MAQKGLTWPKVNGFFEGLAGVTNTIGGIFDTTANIAEDIARGKDALADQRNENADKKQARFLDRLKVMRQDNVQLYWAGAFVAVLGVVLLARK